MPSEIKYQTWSGGSGLGDRQELIGYCEESPKEVLKTVYKTHYIYNYKDVYRPVDCAYPNNSLGLVINEIDEDRIKSMGIASLGSVSDLNLDIAKGKDLKRDEDTYRDALESARRWYLSPSSDEKTIAKDKHKHKVHLKNLNEKCERILKEVEDVIF